MDMENFYGHMRETTLAAFKRFNQTMEVETKRVDFSAGNIAISVVRGRLLEKAATARIRLRTKNPETGEDTQFDVFQIIQKLGVPLETMALVHFAPTIRY